MVTLNCVVYILALYYVQHLCESCTTLKECHILIMKGNIYNAHCF